MKKTFTSILFIVTLILFGLAFFSSEVFVANSNLAIENQIRLEFDHLLYLTNISSIPENVIAGQPFKLEFAITNKGSQFVRDVITKINLPAEITTYNDVQTIKTNQLNPGDTLFASFNLITLPDTKEGIYNLPITVSYINYVGSQRAENETIGLIISSIPNLIIEIQSTEVYEGEKIGKVNFNIINNGLADVKFLTVELAETSDFEIISAKTFYVGDLDSDDFQSANYNIKVKSRKDEIVLPLKLTYKDSINKDYTLEKNITLAMRTAKEMGIKKDYTWLIFWSVIIICVVGYYFYQKKKKQDLKNKMLRDKIIYKK